MSHSHTPGRPRRGPAAGVLFVLAALGLAPAGVRAQEKPQGAPEEYANHGDLSRRRLQIRWTTPAALVNDETQPMERAEVIKELRGRDPRPLLIRREGYEEDERKGDPLQAELDRDEVRLMSHWFHCLRFGRRIMDPRHPYHALFADKKPPALLLITWDGETCRELPADVDRRTLQAAVVAMLKLEYRKDPVATVESWLEILKRFDTLEQDEEFQEARKARAVEKSGEGTTKDKRASAKLAKIEREVADLVKKEKRLQQLVLRHDPAARTEVDFDAEAAAEVNPTSGISDLERLKQKLEEQKKKRAPEPRH
ncbi:MAG: hypothetical protein R3F30_07815 [Planctomycetota bacterium]